MGKYMGVHRGVKSTEFGGRGEQWGKGAVAISIAEPAAPRCFRSEPPSSTLSSSIMFVVVSTSVRQKDVAVAGAREPAALARGLVVGRRRHERAARERERLQRRLGDLAHLGARAERRARRLALGRELARVAAVAAGLDVLLALAEVAAAVLGERALARPRRRRRRGVGRGAGLVAGALGRRRVLWRRVLGRGRGRVLLRRCGSVLKCGCVGECRCAHGCQGQ